MRALLQGRFDACERMAREAATYPEPAARLHATVQLISLRREQGRAPEAEATARDLLGRHPTLVTARATLATVLGDLGRDREARSELAKLAEHDFAVVAGDAGWLPAMCQLAGLCPVVEAQEHAAVLYQRLLPYAPAWAVEPMAAACHGSVARFLGLLAHSLGLWDDAAVHFTQALADHVRAGAPVLAAHTRRQYSAVLRARGQCDDWEVAIELLTQAESTYRRLGIDALAGEAQAVLARSGDLSATAGGNGQRWSRRAGEWELAYGDKVVRLADASGLRDLARLIVQPGRSVPASDLWADGADGTDGTAGDDALAECRARLTELAEEVGEARRQSDAIRLALAEAERELILGELAGELAGHDDPERIRRLVGLRIRLAVDRVGKEHPQLGAHLRHSVRTGTLCTYQPSPLISWTA